MKLITFNKPIIDHRNVSPIFLGAHTAGYAGERIPGIGRITGLDPAEPYFQGMGSSVRLGKFINFSCPKFCIKVFFP